MARGNNRSRSGGYRRQARNADENGAEVPRQSVRPQFAGPVDLPPQMRVSELADVIRRSPTDVIKELMRSNLMLGMNEVVDFSIAANVSTRLGVMVRKPADVEASDASDRLDAQGDDSNKQPRPPVIAIMGHVDHGKTTLLDAIRGTSVVDTEAGGITQSIGAYQVAHDGSALTFIDTPGHEAFTAMRARGAQVTDIAVIVVAADDGVMPQTVEAINHAKAAEVPMVIAINKSDLPSADSTRVKTELLEHDVIVEDLGGEVLAVELSALKNEGIADLLESLSLLSEISELSADPEIDAAGVVIEAKLDKQRGPVATVLVHEGTVERGNTMVAGDRLGRVRRMVDGFGSDVDSAGPSTPIEILGLNGVPETGQEFRVVADEKAARQLLDARKRQLSRRTAPTQASTMAQVMRKRGSQEAAELNVVVKTGSQGTIDAVRRAVDGLSSSDVQVKILHAAAGPISESDVTFATASDALIVGFETTVETAARQAARTNGIGIRTYDIIYTMIDDIRDAAARLMEPEMQTVIVGSAMVQELFPHGSRSVIAGLRVSSGLLRRNARMIVKRNGEELFEGVVSSMRHLNQNVRELPLNMEGGVVLDGFHEYEVGDELVCYEVTEVPRS